MEFIDIKTQYKLYKKEIDAAIHEVLDSCQFIMGPVVEETEEKLAKYVGAKHCISVSSGTDSLLIALMALGVGPGDEVITSPFTFVATAEVIALVGATPVYVDIDLATYNITAEAIEAAITPRTKAIMPVDLFGQMADYTAINAVAKKHGIPVIQDGAQSFGSTQEGKQAMNVTDIGSTSFFPAKPLGCYGDGGALFTNNDKWADKFRELRIHGGIQRHCYTTIGLNSRFDAIQAAVIKAKLPHFSHEVELRKQIGARYTELLQECCITPLVLPQNTSTYAIYTLRIEDRDEVSKQLKERGVPTSVYYPTPVFNQPAYKQKGVTEEKFPSTMEACRTVLGLPMHPWLTENEQDFIVNALQDIVKVTA